MTHWQSPNFFAYFSANSSFPGILGEMMSAAFNIIGQDPLFPAVHTLLNPPLGVMQVGYILLAREMIIGH